MGLQIMHVNSTDSLQFCFLHVHWSSRQAVTTLPKSLITQIWLFCVFLRSVNLGVLTLVMTPHNSIIAKEEKPIVKTNRNASSSSGKKKKKKLFTYRIPLRNSRSNASKGPDESILFLPGFGCIMELKQCIEQQAQMYRHLWKTDHSHIGANTDNVAWWGSRGGDRKDIKDSHWLQRHSYYLMYSAFKMNL